MGNFSFKTFEKGKFIIEAKILGYTTVTKEVMVDAKPLNINFTLKEEITELKAVVIAAGSFEAGDKKKQQQY